MMRRPSPLSGARGVQQCTDPRRTATPPGCASARCPAPRPGAVRLCAACVDRLQGDLYGLLDIYVEAEHVLTRSPVTLRQRVSGSRPVGIVLDDEAVAVRSEMTGMLVSWARLIIDERGLAATDGRDVRSLLCFVAKNLDWLASHPAAADFADEVARLIESAGGLAGPPPARLVQLGPCLLPDCTGTLHAALPVAGADWPSPHHVSCDTGHPIPPRQWILVAERMRRSGLGIPSGNSTMKRAAV